MSTETLPLRRVASQTGTETKQRLLDAAERLVAERGFEGTSMRAVTQLAGVALSAANYHFGSKEELLHATLRRRVGAVNERRLERLGELERSAGDGELALEAVLDAYLRPSFEMRAEKSADGDDPGRYFRHVAVRLFAEPPEVVAPLRQELFGEINARFTAAFARALPGFSRGRAELAMQLTVGVMVHVISGQASPSADADAPASSDYEPLLGDMALFAAAGIRALAATAASSSAPIGAES